MFMIIFKTSDNWSFQSIGVTKDWRRDSVGVPEATMRAFPINRRHQGLATPPWLVREYLRGGVSNQ